MYYYHHKGEKSSIHRGIYCIWGTLLSTLCLHRSASTPQSSPTPLLLLFPSLEDYIISIPSHNHHGQPRYLQSCNTCSPWKHPPPLFRIGISFNYQSHWNPYNNNIKTAWITYCLLMNKPFSLPIFHSHPTHSRMPFSTSEISWATSKIREGQQ